MGSFDRGQRGGGGRSFGRRDSGGPRSFDRPREMTKVTCSNCGKETEVPFRPTGDRPVYCRDCYAKMGGGERRSFGGDRRDNRDSRPPFKKFEENRSQGPNNSVQLSEINAKLDILIKLLTPKQEVKEEVKKKVEAPVEKKVVAKSREARSGPARKKAVKKAPIETPEEV